MDTIKHDKEEIIACGRLPKKRGGAVDLYKVDRLLLETAQTNERVAILRRLLEAKSAQERSTMTFRIHDVSNLGPYREFFQFMNWHWRGFIVRIGNRQLDLFRRPQWSAGVED